MSTDEDGIKLEAIEPTQEDPEKINPRELQSRQSVGKNSLWQRVTFRPVLSVDKSKLFSNVQPTICKRKSSSSGERSLNLRLLKSFNMHSRKFSK